MITGSGRCINKLPPPAPEMESSLALKTLTEGGDDGWAQAPLAFKGGKI